MKKTVTIGDLRQRIRLEQVVRLGDGGGGASESWSLVAVLWAAILPLGGGESVNADGLEGRVTHEIWIRYRRAVVPEMRFVRGARVFEILSVIDVEERHRWLKVLCEERQL